MRTVNGPTERVVIVGAGLAGLSAALRLIAAGRQVTVLESDAFPGGRAGRLDVDGFRFDTGPTVLTMPELIADALGAVGEDSADWLELRRLSPFYRAHYPDGSTLDVRGDPVEMAAEIERVCGSAEAAGYQRFVRFVRRLYHLEINDFIDRNFDSPLDLAGLGLAKLAALGAFRPLAGKVGQFLKDPRTRRIFSFQAMYAGLSPYDALAIYAVIAYLDSVAGVYFPTGGMRAVPDALAGAAVKHGADIQYGRTATAVEFTGGRATAVRTADGDRVAADAVILTPDLPVAYNLLPERFRPNRLSRLTYSPSCFVLHAGSTATYSRIAHHNIHFGRTWRRTFTELIRDHQLMSSPSLLVTNPTRTDPTLAPAGRHTYYLLAPAPNAGSGLDWEILAPRYRDELVSQLESLGYRGFDAGLEIERVTTPADWESAGMAMGTPFAAAHTFGQTGPFRPANLAPATENVVFAGSGTQPGVGVPMVLISGKLAAERITGASAARAR